MLPRPAQDQLNYTNCDAICSILGRLGNNCIEQLTVGFVKTILWTVKANTDYSNISYLARVLLFTAISAILLLFAAFSFTLAMIALNNSLTVGFVKSRPRPQNAQNEPSEAAFANIRGQGPKCS